MIQLTHSVLWHPGKIQILMSVGPAGTRSVSAHALYSANCYLCCYLCCYSCCYLAATDAATCAATCATMLSVLQLKEPGYKRPPAMQNPWSVKGQLFRLATHFWMWGFTPGILIRGLGPVGKCWSEGYARARYAGPNKLKLVKYLKYQLTAGLRNMCTVEQGSAPLVHH